MRSNRKSIKTLEKTQKEYTLYRKLNWKTYKSVHTFFRANVQKRTNPRTEQEMNVKYNDFNMSKKDKKRICHTIFCMAYSFGFRLILR